VWRVERLWTPWRKAFVEGAQEPASVECFLCAKPAQPQHADRDNLLLHRGERTFATLNLYPYNNGHLMVAPYDHTGDLDALDPATAAELMSLTQQSVAALRQAYSPDGFNIGLNLGKAAGAGLPGHLHVHVVPRWNGDTNFMPVLGETKVLPEALDETFDRLVALFRRQGD
jgi:ATP adenylyltransferase